MIKRNYEFESFHLKLSKWIRSVGSTHPHLKKNCELGSLLLYPPTNRPKAVRPMQPLSKRVEPVAGQA